MCEQAKKEGGGIRVEEEDGKTTGMSRKRKDAEGKGALNLVWATAEDGLQGDVPGLESREGDEEAQRWIHSGIHSEGGREALPA